MSCQNCCNRIQIPGNCHIGCNNPSIDIKLKHWHGCGIFPISFDENIVVECSKENIPNKNNTANPSLELMRLLMR